MFLFVIFVLFNDGSSTSIERMYDTRLECVTAQVKLSDQIRKGEIDTSHWAPGSYSECHFNPTVKETFEL